MHLSAPEVVAVANAEVVAADLAAVSVKATVAENARAMAVAQDVKVETVAVASGTFLVNPEMTVVDVVKVEAEADLAREDADLNQAYIKKAPGNSGSFFYAFILQAYF